PVEDDAPGVRRREARETVKARRLAGAVGTEEAEDLALLGGEGDGVERGEAGEALGEPHHLEDAHHATRRGASPPFRHLPPGFVAPAKPALESGTLPRRETSNGFTRPRVECSSSSAGFARATDSWGRCRRGPSRPPPMKRRRWALIIALARQDGLSPDRVV